MLTSPDELRSELRGLTTTVLIKRCAAFRTATKRPVAEQCVRNTMRVVARRIQHFNDEIEVHDVAMKQLVDDTAPQLVAEPGVGYVTAAMFIIAWSHPGRCRSESAYARLAGVAPVPANSGQSQDRHRLNRYGDRKLNRACHIVALARWQLSRTHQGLHRQTPSRRQNRPGDPTLPQALHRPPSLATTRAPEPKNRYLTPIEGSFALHFCWTVPTDLSRKLGGGGGSGEVRGDLACDEVEVVEVAEIHHL